MEERLSLKAVDDYSDDYASKVVAAFFAKKDRITGPEVLKLCSVHQVNLFVIQELLRAWKSEIQKFRSPFFDYHATEVQEALDAFQNVVSNHIMISRENFQPLLKKAVSQTLYLILDPYDFFSDTLDRQGGGNIRAADLRNEIRFLKINRPPLERLVQRLDERGLDLVNGKEAFALLDQILEEVNFTPEDVEAHMQQFSETIPLNYDQLYEKKPSVQGKPEPLVTLRKEAALSAPARKEAKPTIADNFQKIDRIKDSLTINQKFMFTKILFKGDFEIFSKAIDSLDKCTTLEQAMTLIGDTYPEWDREGEEYAEFVELLTKRFS